MIELADVLNRLLQLLIIIEPTANLGDPFTTYAELLRPPARIRHRQHKDMVPFTAHIWDNPWYAGRCAPAANRAATHQ
jgi:hypothetical protein